MAEGGRRFEGLTTEQKRALAEKILREKQSRTIPAAPAGFAFPPEYRELLRRFQTAGGDGIGDLFFQSCDGLNDAHAEIGGRRYLNFCSYNYLGMSGDPRVSAAAKEAIDRYGTSVSASRLVSGERPLHRALERGLAEWIGAEDALVFVGGFSTNENAIGHLMGPGDLIVYDSLIHASVQQGAKLSRAAVAPFPHNNPEALDNILKRRRGEARQVLVVLEGVYSMDGDIPDLPRFIEIKKRHNALLMVDEAHSMGVLGATGRGIGEYFGAAPGDVDLWMGTLSKSLASCGGYIAGSADVVEYLRLTAPGFVYSVGLSPADTAAALASLEVLKSESERVSVLRARARSFVERARAAGLDTGPSRDSAVVPVMVGATDRAIALSRALMERGILVLPIGYPAVPENTARLRFFISFTHREDEIDEAVATTGECLARL
ncbi:MAG: aminotransferase class I/II-fold pyridoxal phosphate-dependent enzyme [Flavobacteriaceae bacterium]